MGSVSDGLPVHIEDDPVEVEISGVVGEFMFEASYSVARGLVMS